MRYALSRFAGALRGAGVRVSAAELIDAARALGTIDVTDRDELRATLGATLAKSREDTARFEETFDRYFVAPGGLRRKKRRRRRKGGRGVPDGEGAGISPSGSPASGSRDTASLVRGVRRRQLEEMHRRRGSTPGAARYPCKVLATRPPARDGRERTDGRSALEAALAQREREGRGQRAHRLGDGATARRAGPLSPATISRKPFRERWEEGEERALAEALERALRRLRVRRVRRRRRARHGTLWIQRIVRTNVGNDGIPFRLVRHRPRRREPRLVLLVDVSHSVARAASAFLALATHIGASLRRVGVHVFVDTPLDVSDRTAGLARARGGRRAIDDLVATEPDLDPTALSDYGRVLYRFLENARGALRHDTVLLVLGDARTNRFDPASWVLEEIRARVKRIVWLVPEPRREWDTGDSVVAAYAPHVDLLAEVADLEGLRLALGHTFGRR